MNEISAVTIICFIIIRYNKANILTVILFVLLKQNMFR